MAQNVDKSITSIIGDALLLYPIIDKSARIANGATQLATVQAICYNTVVAANVSIETLTDVQGFLSLEGEWKNLLGQSNIDAIFLTWHWQRVWWEFFGHEAQLSIVTVRDEDRLIGLAPFYTLPPNENPDTLRLIGGVDVSDYLDVIAARGREELVYTTLWEFLIGENDCPWKAIDLHNVPEASPTRTILPALAGTTEGVQVTMEVEDVCPVIDLPSSWEDYLSLLSRKQRHELRRKIRKAKAQGAVHWYYVEDEKAVRAEMEDFIQLHERSSREKEAFMDQRMQSFFHAVARTTFGQGWLRLAFLLVSDAKVAATLCFDYNDSILVYNSGYDPQLYASLSAGLVLLAYCIQDSIERGCRTFDFLRGEEEYKYRLGAHDTKVYHLRISR